jgi:hypothetical protein
MTTQSSIPLKWYVPFANGDSSRVEIPVTTADPTRASQTLGFPPLTMQPPESGGVPPQGEDFNGGMNQIARVAWWLLNGGGWPYDSVFASNAAINGYPNGAVLQSADFRGNWINTADNNQNNPDTNGTNWVPGFQYGTTALTGLTGGTVTPTPAQAAKNGITIAGTLGSALTVILPTWVKNWTITNNTTGAFVTIVKTAAGSGVTIPQNASPTRVSGDGTNIVQPSENVATATLPNQAVAFVQVRTRLTANLNLFVATTGNDANSGLAVGSPFLTLQRAWNVIFSGYDLNGFNVTVNVAAGSYAAGVFASGPLVGATGATSLTFLGASTFVSVTSNTCFNANNGAAFAVNTISMAATGSSGDGSQGFAIFAGNGATIQFTATNFLACGAAHIGAVSGGNVFGSGNYTISGGSPAHLLTTFRGGVATASGITVTLTGTPAFSAAYVFVASVSTVNVAGTTFSGAATGSRYNVSTNAVLSTNGGGATYLPGNAAGSTATGGQYV